MPDVGVDLLLEPGDLAPELAVERSQRLEVEGDADRLHAGEDRDQRQLDLAEQPLELLVRRGALQRLADRQRRQRLEACSRRGRQLGGRRQDLVEPLRDDVGDRLAAERGVEDVRGDLRVERDRRRLTAEVIREARHEDGLDLVADQRNGGFVEEVPEGVRGLGAVSGDDATVGPRDGERQRCPAARPRVVGQQRHADGRLGRDPVGRAQPTRSTPRTSIRPGSTIAAARARRQVLGGRGRRRGPVARVVGRCRLRDRGRVEVEAELQLPALLPASGQPGPQPLGRACPATRAAGTDPLSTTARRLSLRSSADSPAIGGRRSISVRNSYSRNSRMTVSRS